jgi:hypothetical protein
MIKQEKDLEDNLISISDLKHETPYKSKWANIRITYFYALLQYREAYVLY